VINFTCIFPRFAQWFTRFAVNVEQAARFSTVPSEVCLCLLPRQTCFASLATKRIHFVVLATKVCSQAAVKEL